MAKKDIFDLFREKSAELEQTPSSQAWARIESRMAAKRPSAGRSARVRKMPQPLGIAAALALLLGLSVVFMWLSEQGQSGVLAHQQMPLEMEELQLIVDDPSSSAVEKAPTHLDITTPAKPIVEGNASQKLVAKQESFRDGGPSPVSSPDSIENENRRTGR